MQRFPVVCKLQIHKNNKTVALSGIVTFGVGPNG